LLQVGWLVCQHKSQDDQLRDLWHLINP
jgi:hypothetical protein